MVRKSFRRKTVKDAENWFLEHWQRIILIIFLCAGLAVGAVLVRDYNEGTGAGGVFGSFFDDFMSIRHNSSFGARFVSALSGCILFYIGIMLLGLSIPGVVVIPFVILFRGMGIGLLMAFLYRFRGLSGTAFAILILLPHILLSTWILLSSSDSSMRLSLCLSRQTLSNASAERLGTTGFGKFLLTQAYLALLLGISALLDACLGLCFDRFFYFEGI